MLRISLIFLVLIIVSLVSFFLPNPSLDTANSQSGNVVTIITPHPDEIRKEFARAFIPWYKQKYGENITIEWLDPGGTSDCIRYIRSEFKRSSEGIGIDLFFGGGTDPYTELKNDSLLEQVFFDSTILNEIPSNYAGIQIYDKDHFWYGAVLSGFGIICNYWVASWLKFDLPTEWKDLAKPEFYSWVGVADPRNSGTMHLMFEIILQAYGWEEGWKILTGIAANSRTFSKGASDVPRMVAKGDMAFGLAIDFYGWAEIAEAGEEKVGFVFPEEFSVINADAFAMLKGAPNKKGTKAFMEYVLSEEGQKKWYLRKGETGGPINEELGRMPVRKDMYVKYKSKSNVKQNPFAHVSKFHLDHELVSKRWAIINDLAGVALIDNNDALQKAWFNTGAIKKCDSLWKSFPENESSTKQLIEQWKNPLIKNRKLKEWHAFFTNKYSSLSKGVSCTK